MLCTHGCDRRYHGEHAEERKGDKSGLNRSLNVGKEAKSIQVADEHLSLFPDWELSVRLTGTARPAVRIHSIMLSSKTLVCQQSA